MNIASRNAIPYIKLRRSTDPPQREFHIALQLAKHLR